MDGQEEHGKGQKERAVATEEREVEDQMTRAVNEGFVMCVRTAAGAKRDRRRQQRHGRKTEPVTQE
jgi:hypothetical protein